MNRLQTLLSNSSCAATASATTAAVAIAAALAAVAATTAAATIAPGRGVVENSNWTDVESTNLVRTYVRVLTLDISHAPTDLGRVLFLNDPVARYVAARRRDHHRATTAAAREVGWCKLSLSKPL